MSRKSPVVAVAAEIILRGRAASDLLLRHAAMTALLARLVSLPAGDALGQLAEIAAIRIAARQMLCEERGSRGACDRSDPRTPLEQGGES